MGSMITNNGRCTRNEIQNCHSKSSIKQEKYFFISKLELNFKKTRGKCYIWSIIFMVLKFDEFRKAEQKCLENFVM